PSTCDEISLLNGLDGWSVNPRMTLAFTGRVALDSITRTSAFVLPLGHEASEPVGLSRLVWDPEGRTLYAMPERVLRQGQLHALATPARSALDLAPPAAVSPIPLGSFDSASFLTGSRHIPRAPSSQAPPILGHERVQAIFFLPEGAMPPAGWPVIVFGHGFGNDKNLITPLVAGGFA